MNTLNLGTFAPTNLAIDLNQDVYVSCIPGLHSRYFGTEKQLRKEGLVPDHLHFPDNARHVIKWSQSGQQRTLQRAKKCLLDPHKSLWANDLVWCVQVDVA